MHRKCEYRKDDYPHSDLQSGRSAENCIRPDIDPALPKRIERDNPRLSNQGHKMTKTTGIINLKEEELSWRRVTQLKSEIKMGTRGEKELALI